jgi:GTP-binding protein
MDSHGSLEPDTGLTRRLPVVAVIGRPNVGKSTLVNRIVGSRKAVVEASPGVTRDRRDFEAEWAGHRFLVVDTGGWEDRPEDDLGEAIRFQAEAALSGADLVVFVVDATASGSADDAGVVRMLRRSRVPVVLAANKVDDAGQETGAADLWGMGLGEPSMVSAIHGRGMGDLLDRIVSELPQFPEEQPAEDIPRIAIVGRPNVGKSTLLNRLARSERVIVSPEPGTTRDPIDVSVRIGRRDYWLVDTAGIRRRPQIPENADLYSVDRARDAAAESDLALVMIDAIEGVTNQDQRIVSELVEAGVGIVLLLNKWDAVEAGEREHTEELVTERLAFADWAPLLTLSAKTGLRVGRLGRTIDDVLEARARRIGTGELNRLVREWTAAHPPPVRSGRRPRLQYAVQAGTSPPTFVLFISGGELGDDYLRFLQGRIRGVVDFTGSPIRMVTRAK